MPILKQLVTNSASAKRRSRADLTAAMISAPLGDFRHTMHIGRSGDAFGDTSFLTTKPEEAEPEELGSKPGLLSRTFRSSKRSQSVTRSDKRDMLGSLRDSALFVKNAVSLPQLTEKEAEKGSRKLPKSLSSSPVKKTGDEKLEEKHMNGASAHGATPSLDPIVTEQDFGELTELPYTVPKNSYGMKHAESIMSFHVDLGPSMLGDILSIMDKTQWDQDEMDLGCPAYERGFERELSSRTTTPAHQPYTDHKPSVAPVMAFGEEMQAATYSPGSGRSTGSHLTKDSSSVSSCTSGSLEERHEVRSVRHMLSSTSGSNQLHDKDFSFMDEEDDEIRV
ncbi:cdc42 effector protein 4 [Microcaecilia unicolor]|uniref:Cdc42 effector protein 4 n=1 Tax=Microcaecilia unicolor TaxID=1415580 RepID=A0A6P7YAA5_9AMPH|nr:cdc42 effector protein 4 [Microcaecilia unicolor]XP_030064395.1 cdc42 effector protein 4 [Microcaecilia unicolor]XP_030064396.1 cdc42 effector protein 4 [Microcaecilia unicolor]XP_030064397.1 cdc42 effector protein 4 [Microcaecilia unicolor]